MQTDLVGLFEHSGLHLFFLQEPILGFTLLLESFNGHGLLAGLFPCLKLLRRQLVLSLLLQGDHLPLLIDTTIFGALILQLLPHFRDGALSVLSVLTENLLPGYSLVLKEPIFLLDGALLQLVTLLFQLLFLLHSTIQLDGLVVLEAR